MLGVRFVEIRLPGRQHELVHDGPVTHTLTLVRETACQMTDGTGGANSRLAVHLHMPRPLSETG